MKKYHLYVIIIILALLVSFVFVYFRKNSWDENISTNQKKEHLKLELYEDPGNNPHMIGEPIIKDIDNDGLIEKVIRYDLLMADRSIQVLYIYREIDGEYKLIKKFEGDPYGFAKMVDENRVVVGRFLPIQGDVLKNWDDFEQFEIVEYKWTGNGEIEINKNITKASSVSDLDEEIKNNFSAIIIK